MAKKNKGLGYNLSDYNDYETAPFNYDDRISEYMNSKVGNNKNYRLQRINDLHHSIEMERNHLPENFSVGGFSTGSTNPNAHVPLGVATSGWKPGMKKPNLQTLSEQTLSEIPSNGNPNWTFYKDKAKKFIKEENDIFFKDMGKAYQGFQSLGTSTKRSIAAVALSGVAAAFLSSRAEESDTKISKKINTF